MRGRFMFSKGTKSFLILAIAGFTLNVGISRAEEAGVASVSAASLPINSVTQEQKNATTAMASNDAGALVSPSQAQAVAQKTGDANAKPNTSTNSATIPVQAPTDSTTRNTDFNLDLKMQAMNQPSSTVQLSNPQQAMESDEKSKSQAEELDIPQDIQYKANPVENLGNSVLSQMDSDLFSQMSEIEKSTTLLTLELRREKIRNEIEAQKAIRRKQATDFEKQQAEDKLKSLERKKQIEAQVLKEQQLLIDKEKVFEVLKQRKLLNAYMNQMLLTQQEWLKEKESLYARLEVAEQERKELIELFKRKIDKVLEASAKNIQTAEAAKVNFERIVKGLKARNEQLRKRIEADAQIIKNAKSNLYLKAQSLEELKDRNAASLSAMQAAAANSIASASSSIDAEADNEETSQKKLSAEYAILGITGRSGVMSIDLIDSQGQTLSLKVGSPLPTGHVVSEIGSDYAKFNKDGHDDYLYVGKSIDGMVPTLGLLDTKKK